MLQKHVQGQPNLTFFYGYDYESEMYATFPILDILYLSQSSAQE